MKKVISITLLCAVTLCLLCGCNVNYLNKASRNADCYDIAISYDEEHHIVSAVQTVTFTNRTENTFTAVKFHIYPNAYRQDAKTCIVPTSYKAVAYPCGESFGDVTFDSVKVNDESVAFIIEGQDMDILSVPVKELYPNESVNITMVYELHLANTKHRLGYTDNVVNLGNFYPIVCRVEKGEFCTTPYYNVGDPFVSDVANYSVTVTLPKNYVVASSGQLCTATNGEETCTYTYEATAMRDFALILSDKYQKLTAQQGDTTVSYYYFADTSPENSLATAVSMFKYMSEHVGKYPYGNYSVCETDFCFGGMEYPCLSMVASGSKEYAEAVIHETAHQWFYSIVGNDQINNAWMDEGLAEFLTMLQMDKTGVCPLATAVKQNTKTFTTYVDVLNNFYQKSDTSMRSIGNYKNDSEYVCMTYVKGSLLFNTLYELMGEKKFLKALQYYFETAKMTVASPDTMIDSFTKANGADVRPVFESFINGTEIIGEMKKH